MQKPESVENDERRKSRETGRAGGSNSSPGRARRDKELAFSTGQAARYCYVTSYTIVNWIRSGKLRAQKTAGGQYRICVNDLRQFMRENKMRTDLLEEELNIQPYCWEFHCQPGEEGFGRCEQCLVYRSGAGNCYELRGVIPPTECLFNDCTSCEYYQTWGPPGTHAS
jgi:excisionase family DNA binding protein